jgi:CRISPR-associated protein Cmr1
MKRYIVSCRVITPLFMGGADQQAELRTQSINGMLRWWFRVAGGSKKDEEILFGWGGEKANQGLVRIFIKDFDRLRKEKFSKEFDDKGMVRQDKGINYIGFSLDQRFKIDQQGKIQREYIKENQTFDLKISFHPRSTEDDIKKFFATLWLAFNLGNFGSRSRRGFGSIKIEKIEEDGRDITNNCFGLNFLPSEKIRDWIDQNLELVEEILKHSPRKGIPYLSNNLLLPDTFDIGENWQNLLDKIGRAYKEFRKTKRRLDRIVFGLPIIQIKDYKNLRRASPLMFKIIQFMKGNEPRYALLPIGMVPNEKHKFIFHPNLEGKVEVNWRLISEFAKNPYKGGGNETSKAPRL